MVLVTPVEPVPLGELGRVHVAGIGGAGMSGVARIMLARGVAVSGCDSAASSQLDELAALGAQVCVGHSAGHLDSADTFVMSSAIRANNPALVQARRTGMRVLHRAAALACATLGRPSITVAGTHGKTTTTAMITTVLRRSGADPADVIGGILAETGIGSAEGTGRPAAGMATDFELAPGGRGVLAGRGSVRLRVEVPGRHNALNAAAAYATATELGFGQDGIAAGLAGYRGARRRMEPKGEADAVRVLDSYAHHPTELAADLRAARDIAAGGRLIVVFQPHLFSRTRILAAQFGAALGLADESFVLDVYAARA